MTTTTIFTLDDLTTTNGGRTRVNQTRQVPHELASTGLDYISLTSLVKPVVSTVSIVTGDDTGGSPPR